MKFILVFFFLVSCKAEVSSQLSRFIDFSSFELAVTKNLQLPPSQMDYNNPPYLWRKIWETEGTCLWYRTPAENADGMLKLFDQKNCDDYSKKPILEIEGVKSLGLSVDRRLRLTLKFNEHNHIFEFPLTNLEVVTREEVALPRLDSKKELSSAASQINELTLRIYKNKLSEVPKFPKLGSLDLSYQHKTALFCHRFDEQCHEIIAFHCQSCLGGWSEVVSYRCGEGKTSKICGRDRCGEKGEPACPRGESQLNLEDDEGLCFEGSRAGFCQDGLVTSCDENQVLICL